MVFQRYLLNSSLIAIIGFILSNQLIASDVTSQPDVISKNETVHYCPYPCLIGNITECFPVPCPLPPCVDGKKIRPEDCCKGCPNGFNCRGPDGKVIQWKHWEIVDGKNCTCTGPPGPTTCI